MLCGVCISPHSTFVCNTAAKTLLPEYGQKGYNSRVVRNFRCVGGVFTRIGPQVFAALGARRIIFCTSWLSFYPFRAKLTSPFFTFYAWSPSCLFHGAGRGPFFCCSEGAALWPGGREARHGSTLGAGRQVQQGGEQGGSRSMQFPAAGVSDFEKLAPVGIASLPCPAGRRTGDLGQGVPGTPGARRPGPRGRERHKKTGDRTSQPVPCALIIGGIFVAFSMCLTVALK